MKHEFESALMGGAIEFVSCSNVLMLSFLTEGYILRSHRSKRIFMTFLPNSHSFVFDFVGFDFLFRYKNDLNQYYFRELSKFSH